MAEKQKAPRPFRPKPIGPDVLRLWLVDIGNGQQIVVKCTEREAREMVYPPERGRDA